MAEILGIASGVVTIAEGVGRLGVTLLKLKSLWDEVKDVPNTILEIMTYLELLKPLLSEMENHLSPTYTIAHSESLAMLSLEYSRKAMQDLACLASDLHKQISSGRKLRQGVVRLKVVLKKSLLNSYQVRLQSALQLLSISQQSYTV